MLPKINKNVHGNDICPRTNTCTGGHYTCNDKTGDKICLPGWKGYSCAQKDIALDSYFNLTCPDNECRNHGICVSGTCCCQPGYTGVLCQIETIECQSRPCQNGGTCLDLVGRYECSCKPGYTGKDCETYELTTSPTTSLIPLCDTHTCANGGTCYQDFKSTYCVCPLWYSGKYCENHLTPSNVSQNKSCPENTYGYNCSVHCISHNSCYGGHYICDPIDGKKICLVGWMGVDCDIRRLPQDLDPTCPSNLTCKNGGQCFEERCCCKYHFSGQFCNIDSIGCLSSPCQNGATCVPISNQTTDYNCNCTNNFEGELCETKASALYNVFTSTIVHANNHSDLTTSKADVHSTNDYTNPDSSSPATNSFSSQAWITTSQSFISDGDTSSPSSPSSQTTSKHYTELNITTSTNTPYSSNNTQEDISTSSTVSRRQTTSTESPDMPTLTPSVPDTTLLAMSPDQQHTQIVNTTQKTTIFVSNATSYRSSQMAPITTTSSNVMINITSNLSTAAFGHTGTIELPTPTPSPSFASTTEHTSSSSVPGMSQQTYITTKTDHLNSVDTTVSTTSSVATTTSSTHVQTSAAYFDKTTVSNLSEPQSYLSTSVRRSSTSVSHPSTVSLNSTPGLVSVIPSLTSTTETANTSALTSRDSTTNTSPNLKSTISTYVQSEHSSLQSQTNYTSTATTLLAHTITANISTSSTSTVSHLSSVPSGQIGVTTSEGTTFRLNVNTQSNSTRKTTTANLGDMKTTSISTESQTSSLSPTTELPVFLQSTNTGNTHHALDTAHVEMSSTTPTATSESLLSSVTTTQSPTLHQTASPTTIVLLSKRQSTTTQSQVPAASTVNHSKTILLSSLTMSTEMSSVNSTGENSTTSPLKSQLENSSSTWWIILVGIVGGIVFLAAISVMFLVLFRFIRSTESRTLKRTPEEMLKFDREHFSAVPEIDNPVYMDEPDFQDDTVKSDIYVVNR